VVANNRHELSDGGDEGMQKLHGKVVIETLGTSEDEIFTKEYEYEDGICVHSQDAIDIRLEICRENEIQTVVWYREHNVGGTWYDPTKKTWVAELMGFEWNGYDIDVIEELRAKKQLAARANHAECWSPPSR
jgi:hypothetical protein